jgi:hypothetical protein
MGFSRILMEYFNLRNAIYTAVLVSTLSFGACSGRQTSYDKMDLSCKEGVSELNRELIAQGRNMGTAFPNTKFTCDSRRDREQRDAEFRESTRKDEERFGRRVQQEREDRNGRNY